MGPGVGEQNHPQSRATNLTSCIKKCFLLQNDNTGLRQLSGGNSSSIRLPKIWIPFLVNFHCPLTIPANIADASFLFFPCLMLLLHRQMWPDQGSPDNVCWASWPQLALLQSATVSEAASRFVSISVFVPSGYAPLLPDVLCAHSPHPILPHLKEAHSFLFVVYPPLPWPLRRATSVKNCFFTWTVSGRAHAVVFSVWCAHISTLHCQGNCMNNNDAECMCSLMLCNEYLKFHALYLHPFYF